MLLDEKNSIPLDLLKEIEAYLSFRLLADKPNMPETEMRSLRRDILQCLKDNGIEP